MKTIKILMLAILLGLFACEKSETIVPTVTEPVELKNVLIFTDTISRFDTIHLNYMTLELNSLDTSNGIISGILYNDEYRLVFGQPNQPEYSFVTITNPDSLWHPIPGHYTTENISIGHITIDSLDLHEKFISFEFVGNYYTVSPSIYGGKWLSKLELYVDDYYNEN